MFGFIKQLIADYRAQKAMIKCVKLLQAEDRRIQNDIAAQVEMALLAMPREEALERCRKIRES